ncbi:MAG: DUF4129 domain-containing protein, partial [Armatimonadetes bacterium]|nr:DUF4129 domain-containing protein [Armatimonadota bacterium]
AASQSVHSFDLTTVIGRYVQIRLARLVASWMIRQPVQHVSHEPRLTLYTPAPASNQPLFEVSTDGPDSWRMTTYETYQHGIWSRKYGRTHRARKIGQFIALPVVAGSGVSDRGERVRMEVTARVPMAGAIPSLLWPRFLQAPDRMDEKNFHIDATGTVISSRYFRPGDRYTIIAVDPRGWPGQLDKKLRAACLQLPPDLPPRVKKLAWQIAGKSTAPSARVSALATYLRDNYTYDPFPPLPPRRQGDPTDYFLFVSKRGYCAHFASALALMCRAIGYPARVVSGFLGTEFVGGARDKSGAYLVRAKDAHAWVEVYLPGEGWVSFDPTPPRPPGPSEVAAQAWDRMTTAVSRAIVSAGRWAAGHIAEAAALVGLCVLGAVARRYRRWADVTSVSTPPGLSPTQQIVHLYRQMLRWLELYDGFPPLPHTTPLEIAERLGSEWGYAKYHARVLAMLYTEAIFSGRPMPAEKAAAAKRAAERVRARWLSLRRLYG